VKILDLVQPRTRIVQTERVGATMIGVSRFATSKLIARKLLRNSAIGSGSRSQVHSGFTRRRELLQQNAFGQEGHHSSGAIYAAYLLAASLASLSASTAEAKQEADPGVTGSCSTERYSLIVVGGGTAGCTVAYLSAKWMQDNDITGKVLLVDKGVDFFDAKQGPDPHISGWFDNWGSFGEAHPSLREDGSDYPVTVRRFDVLFAVCNSAL
jgi:hypothetical protein